MKIFSFLFSHASRHSTTWSRCESASKKERKLKFYVFHIATYHVYDSLGIIKELCSQRLIALKGEMGIDRTLIHCLLCSDCCEVKRTININELREISFAMCEGEKKKKKEKFASCGKFLKEFFPFCFKSFRQKKTRIKFCTPSSHDPLKEKTGKRKMSHPIKIFWLHYVTRISKSKIVSSHGISCRNFSSPALIWIKSSR